MDVNMYDANMYDVNMYVAISQHTAICEHGGAKKNAWIKLHFMPQHI